MTLIEWITNPGTTSTPTTVPKDGLLRGVGSKQITLNYTGSDSAITVTPNVRWLRNEQTGENIFTDWTKTAVIENLIIDGQGSTNAIGIKLEDVYNYIVRNVTIKNFEVGIKLSATDKYDVVGGNPVSTGGAVRNFSEMHTIKHVRLENVKTGILFDTGTGDGSFAFTKIDDVGIQLKNDSSAVGIQVGNTTDTSVAIAHPYSSFMRAHVWIQSAGGTGLRLRRGEIKYGLTSLTVNGPSNGYGADLSAGNANDCITGNQISGFYLTCAGIAAANRVIGSVSHDIDFDQSY